MQAGSAVPSPNKQHMFLWLKGVQMKSFFPYYFEKFISSSTKTFNNMGFFFLNHHIEDVSLFLTWGREHDDI